MNHRLDILLHKNNANIMEEVNDRLELSDVGINSEAAEIRLLVAKKLNRQLAPPESKGGYARLNDFRLLTPY